MRCFILRIVSIATACLLLASPVCAATVTHTVTGVYLGSDEFPDFTFDFVDANGDGLASVNEITAFGGFSRPILNDPGSSVQYVQIVRLMNSSATRGGGAIPSPCNGATPAIPGFNIRTTSPNVAGAAIGFRVLSGSNLVNGYHCFLNGWELTTTAQPAAGISGPVTAVPVLGAGWFAALGLAGLLGMSRRKVNVI